MTRPDDFKQKLRIDEHALERELRDHPTIMWEIGNELATAISSRDAAKQSLDEIEALVDKELRLEASKSDERITEKQIESDKKLDKRVKKATENFLSIKLEAARWSALKDAFEQRSYALSKLVELYLANYYGNIEVKGSSDFKTVQASHVKAELKRRRVSPT